MIEVCSHEDGIPRIVVAFENGRRFMVDQVGVFSIRNKADSSGRWIILYNSLSEEYPDQENKIHVSAKCGQKAEFDLDSIDSEQEIDEVTIRGVKYVRE